MNAPTSLNITVQVKYFASVREALGAGELVKTAAPTVGALLSELLERGPSYHAALGQGRPVRAALNQILCDANAALQDGDELAFFPPVTGG